jgi:two-component system sensor histidine kinase YesM
MDSLSDIFKTSNLKNGEYYAIIDNSGKYLYNSEKMNLIGEKADEKILSITKSQIEGWQIINQNDHDYLISYSNYPGNGWNVVHVLPMRYISANAESVRNYILLILFISLLILLPLLILMSRNLSRPIKKLKTTVEKFGSGDLSTREKTSGRMDEIGNLQTSFNKMADDITSLLSIINDEHKQRRLLEFNILEYQINPHFLYNSLDSINWMAKVSGNKDIEDIVCALAKYLRIGLSKGKEVFEVRNELEHVRQYLLINMIRFKDCFNFEINAEPDLLNCKTIKIILQPIVENAIKYGINKKNTNGYIKITARRDGESVLFEVTDNGPGIPLSKIQAIHNLLADHTIDSESENGFGFYNVNQRIWLHYGDGYGITIDESSSLDMGTTVKIRIPLIKSGS